MCYSVKNWQILRNFLSSYSSLQSDLVTADQKRLSTRFYRRLSKLLTLLHKFPLSVVVNHLYLRFAQRHCQRLKLMEILVQYKQLRQ